MQKPSKKGFTLIELLVVIAIIGILSSIVLASLDSSRKKGRDARRLSDIKQLQLALEVYYDQNNAFPPSISTVGGSCSQTSPNSCASLYLTVPGYISVVPTDPSDQRNYSYIPYGSTSAAGTCISYHLGADLETAGHSALQQDKDQNDVAAYPAGMQLCTAPFSPASGGFNGTDSAKCNNLDAGVTCYDVTP